MGGLLLARSLLAAKWHRILEIASSQLFPREVTQPMSLPLRFSNELYGYFLTHLSEIIVWCSGVLAIVVGAVLKHWLDMRRLSIEVKHYPARVLYDKQTEFFDKLPPLLHEINGYITEIDVWLSEKTEKAKEELARASANNSCLFRFYDLVEQYHVYLPEKLISEANSLFSACFLLGQKSSYEQIDSCWKCFASFRNSIREFVGVEALSRELQEAFQSAGKRAKEARES